MGDALPKEIVQQVEALGCALVQVAQSNQDAPLAVLEQGVLTVVRAALPGLLGAVVRLSQRSLQPAGAGQRWRCPGCGGRSRVQRWKERRVLTVCGPLRYERPWCRCQQCRRGFSPTDQTLGVAPRARLSAGVRGWVIEVGATTSFVPAAQLLARLTGLRVSPETVRQKTEAHGAALEVAQAQAAIAVLQPQGVAPVAPAPGQLVVETDGVMVRFTDGWHEVKIGVVGGHVGGKLTAMSYTAARMGPEQFGPRLLAEAARRGALAVVGWAGSPLQPRRAVLRRVIVVADGAPWIWHLAAEQFGTRVEVVDWYHASEHLWTVAKALSPEKAAVAAWAEARLNELWEQGPAPVQAALAAARAPTPEAQEVLRREQGYFRTNAARMDYPRYRAAGLPVGSGAVESAARHVVQQRLKRAGCRWSDAGGQALVNVCCQMASAA